jgi:hypothetical protein
VLASCESVQSVDRRAAATVTLLTVAVAAVYGMALAPAPPLQSPALPSSAAPVERRAAAPVKIIGATPRSEACQAQVWPYIEGRCLVRAAATPATTSAETTGAVPVQAPPPTALDDVAQSRAATAYLQLPPRRVLSSSTATDVWADDAVEEPAYGTQRRRTGRRAYRGERNWSRRQAFPFFFR